MRKLAPVAFAAALLGARGIAAPPEKAPQMVGESVLSTPLDEFGGAITANGNRRPRSPEIAVIPKSEASPPVILRSEATRDPSLRSG